MSPLDATDAELLALMVPSSGDEELARRAWEEMYLRQRKYLYVVVWRAYGTYLESDGTSDLVVDALRKAYEWARRQDDARYVIERFESDSPEVTRRKVRAWLGVISERLFKDRYRSTTKSEERAREYEMDVRRAELPSGDNDEEARVRSALASLGETDQSVLRLSLPWYDVATSAFQVPRGVASKLAVEAGITPSAFRQRRHRALAKLRRALSKAQVGEEGQ